MSATARFALPLLAAGQAQKEMVHNEALQTLDLLAAAAVDEPPRAAPPEAPLVGSMYIVAAGATGDWVGRDQCLAGYTDGGWRFIQPRPGMLAYVVSASVWSVYRDGLWETGSVRGLALLLDGQQVVGARGAAIPNPSGGGVVDVEARATVGQMLSALRTHGLIAT